MFYWGCTLHGVRFIGVPGVAAERGGCFIGGALCAVCVLLGFGGWKGGGRDGGVLRGVTGGGKCDEQETERDRDGRLRDREGARKGRKEEGKEGRRKKRKQGRKKGKKEGRFFVCFFVIRHKKGRKEEERELL